jgi:hypothetical protein
LQSHHPGWCFCGSEINLQQAAKFFSVGLAVLAARSVLADVSETVATPGSEPRSAPQIASAANGQAEAQLREDLPFAAGVRFGLFPPVLTALEISLRPANHIAMSAYGIFLGGDGARLLIAASLTAEMGERGQSGWYLSTGFLHYHQSKNSTGFYETAVIVPLTAGYLFRTGRFEVQLGAGAQLVVVDDMPPCTGLGCLKLFTPPFPLPALDLGLRYRF